MTDLLPDAVVDELLRRWSEPHRHYHSETHLRAGLAALDRLGAGPLERIAFWFHDAVHSNTTPSDEEASADLARRLLVGHRSPSEIDEVRRLVLLTASHRPAADDLPGARVCDADLSPLAAPWEQYVASVAGIRAELPRLDDDRWRDGRSAFLEAFLRRDRLFWTPLGRQAWEEAARANMSRELAALRVA